MLIRHKEIVSALANIAVIFGVPIFIFQHIDQISQEKVKNTFALYSSTTSDSIFERKIFLNSIWSDIDIVEIENAGISDAALKKLIFDIAYSKAGTFDALFAFDEFLYSIEICVKSRVCDRKTAIALFSNDAKIVSNIYYEYIEHVRKERNIPNFGNSIVAFLHE